jgi:hypothetical protein
MGASVLGGQQSITTKDIYYFPGTKNIYTNAGVISTPNATYTVAMSATMNISGKVRISYDHKIANSGYYSDTSLTVSGAQVDRGFTSGTTFTLRSVDVDVKTGDVIQLSQLVTPGSSGIQSTVQNLKIGVLGEVI